jgi:hypothetical protein
MSGKSKARREAKAADRVARGERRIDAAVRRAQHIRIIDEITIMSPELTNALYDSFVAVGAVLDAQSVPSTGRLVYNPLIDEVVPMEDFPLSTQTLAQEIDDGMLAMAAAGAEVYEPHCLMAWKEQMAGTDDMAGIPNERNE